VPEGGFGSKEDLEKVEVKVVRMNVVRGWKM
jgi:hypothetical protein